MRINYVVLVYLEVGFSMIFEDLREFIKKVDEIGELKKIDGADLDTDIGAINEIVGWTPNHPALIFDNIKGYPAGYRFFCHFDASPKRARLVYNIPDDIKDSEIAKWWEEKLRNYKPIPPVMVDNGPVKENIQQGEEVNLLKFPAAKWHDLDVARFLATGSVTIMKDPDTGYINVGCYRGQVYDKNTLGHHFAAGHDGQVIRDKYFAKGKSCPVAISLGHDPTLLIAAGTSIPWNESEYEWGGWLRGAPYKVIRGVFTDLPIPATSEIVLEGEVLPPSMEECRIEGPWGEAAGYYSTGIPEPPIKIRAVLYRNNPINLSQITLTHQQGHGLAVGLANNIGRQILLEKSGLPGIVGVGRVGPFFVISIKQMYSGHALRAADYFMSGLADRPPRFLVIVDEDIDPSNINDVSWAISTRCEPAEQVHILRQRWCNETNPAGLTPEKREADDITSGTMIIDACKPYKLKEYWDVMFKTIDISEKRRAEVAEKWNGTLGPLIEKKIKLRG